MQNPDPFGSRDPRSRFKGTSCTCSFCLRVFFLRDASETELSAFLSHLEKDHGLKLGEPKP